MLHGEKRNPFTQRGRWPAATALVCRSVQGAESFPGFSAEMHFQHCDLPAIGDGLPPFQGKGMLGCFRRGPELGGSPPPVTHNNFMSFINNPVNHPNGPRRKIEKAEDEIVAFARV